MIYDMDPIEVISGPLGSFYVAECGHGYEVRYARTGKVEGTFRHSLDADAHARKLAGVRGSK